jgi:hypothetical protein
MAQHTVGALHFASALALPGVGLAAPKVTATA